MTKVPASRCSSMVSRPAARRSTFACRTKRSLCLLMLSIATTSLAEDPVVGRSMVATEYGIVAASQPLAARAGVQILERGGNAIDAAIAANATIGLMEPTGNGIGGDLFAIIYMAKTGEFLGLNASGWAPKALDIEHLASKDIEAMPRRGIYSVTVPGVVAGWDALAGRLGKLPLSEILAPAIHYAENGFPLSEVIASGWKRSEEMLASHPNSKKTFLIDGRAPKAGEVFKKPGPCSVAAPSGRARPRRLLQRPDCESHSCHLGRNRRRLRSGGSCRVRARMDGADPNDLSRLDRERDRTQHSRHRCAHDA